MISVQVPLKQCYSTVSRIESSAIVAELCVPEARVGQVVNSPGRRNENAGLNGIICDNSTDQRHVIVNLDRNALLWYLNTELSVVVDLNVLDYVGLVVWTVVATGPATMLDWDVVKVAVAQR